MDSWQSGLFKGVAAFAVRFAARLSGENWVDSSPMQGKTSYTPRKSKIQKRKPTTKKTQKKTCRFPDASCPTEESRLYLEHHEKGGAVFIPIARQRTVLVACAGSLRRVFFCRCHHYQLFFLIFSYFEGRKLVVRCFCKNSMIPFVSADKSENHAIAARPKAPTIRRAYHSFAHFGRAVFFHCRVSRLFSFKVARAHVRQASRTLSRRL
jgi:hypothetical protein